MSCVFACVRVRNVVECVCLWETDSGALTRQALMHVFIRARGEAERTGQ